ncbi:hypothetical protein ACTFIU_008480 [Dictyostelium citrinum]
MEMRTYESYKRLLDGSSESCFQKKLKHSLKVTTHSLNSIQYDTITNDSNQIFFKKADVGDVIKHFHIKNDGNHNSFEQTQLILLENKIAISDLEIKEYVEKCDCSKPINIPRNPIVSIRNYIGGSNGESIDDYCQYKLKRNTKCVFHPKKNIVNIKCLECGIPCCVECINQHNSHAFGEIELNEGHKEFKTEKSFFQLFQINFETYVEFSRKQKNNPDGTNLIELVYFISNEPTNNKKLKSLIKNVINNCDEYNNFLNK